MYMFKGTKCKMLLLLSMLIILFSISVYASEMNGEVLDGSVTELEEVRAVWVTTIYGLDFPSKATTDKEILMNEIDEVLENVEAMGFNTVYFQVRPAADALYSSKIFPWSKYLTGVQGLAPEDDFDPMTYFIGVAHGKGIEVHAWLNPYRVTNSQNDAEGLVSNHPARLHPEWVVDYQVGKTSKLYFNPGIPEVEQLISDGIEEIIDNYDVDGIHLDDYFYPGRDFNDYSTYVMYGKEYEYIEDWRRANINSLVESIYNLVKEKDRELQFGVSPFAIWANDNSQPLGSDTRGSESYYKHYADTRGWVKAGYLDYIMPQIYWNIGFEIADYEKLLYWWSDVVAGTEVDLYIGQAPYRTGNSDVNSPWHGVDEIERQVNLNRETDHVGGYSMFRYKSLANNPELVRLMKELNE